MFCSEIITKWMFYGEGGHTDFVNLEEGTTQILPNAKKKNGLNERGLELWGRGRYQILPIRISGVARFCQNPKTGCINVAVQYCSLM